MRWLRWFSRNWADTDEGDPGPVVIPLPLAQALVQVEEAIHSLPRWQIESVDAQTTTIHATRRTRVCRFIDDIAIRLEPTETGTRIHVRSQSRFGIGDLGQNSRNLRELLAFISP
jgi:uncharacterized protein (DUF1499 family)